MHDVFEETVAVRTRNRQQFARVGPVDNPWSGSGEPARNFATIICRKRTVSSNRKTDITDFVRAMVIVMRKRKFLLVDH